MLKVAGSELGKRKAELALSIDGLDSLEAGSRPAYDWLSAPASTIGGGSTEIQLNIIAKRGLELPGA